MKNLTTILLLLFCLDSFPQITPIKGADNGLLLTNLSNTTVILTKAQSPYSYVYLGNCKNVTIINQGGVVELQKFDFENSQKIKVTGSGSADRLGFLLTQHTTEWNGIYASNVHGKSKDIEFERCKIDSSGGGLWWKNEHFCDPSLSDWVLSNLSFHDGEISNVHEHGSYIGATEVENKTRPSYCGGDTVYNNPSRTSGIKIYNVKIWNIGKNGLMICDCRYEPAEIYNVEINNTGTGGDPAQGQGMALGGFAKARLNNVRIYNSATWNLRSSGSDTVIIQNSYFQNAGWDNVVISLADSNYKGKMFFQSCYNVGHVSVDPLVNYSSCASLPVRIVKFTAKKINKSVLLEWQAEGAINYQVDRSQDGYVFSKLASTTSNQLLDLIPLSGMNFYRLKAFESSGSFSYSSVAMVQFGKQKARAQVMDAIGRKLIDKNIEDINALKNSLKPGFYIIQINSYHEKFIKQ